MKSMLRFQCTSLRRTLSLIFALCLACLCLPAAVYAEPETVTAVVVMNLELGYAAGDVMADDLSKIYVLSQNSKKIEPIQVSCEGYGVDPTTTWPGNAPCKVIITIEPEDTAFQFADDLISVVWISPSSDDFRYISPYSGEDNQSYYKLETTENKLTIHWPVIVYDRITPEITELSPYRTGAAAHVGATIDLKGTPASTDYSLQLAYVKHGMANVPANQLLSVSGGTANKVMGEEHVGSYDLVLTVTLDSSVDGHSRLSDEPSLKYADDSTVPLENLNCTLSDDYRTLTITYENFLVITDHTPQSGNYNVDASNHTYTCDICSAVISESHTFDTAYDSMGDDGHFHVCVCGAQTETEAHSSSQDYRTNTTSHWQVCDACGIGYGVTVHETPVQKYDETSHWTECPVCGYKMEAASAHTWDEGTETKAPTVEEEGETTFTCTVCSQTRTEPIAKLDPEPAPSPKPSSGGSNDLPETIPEPEVPLAGTTEGYSWADRGEFTEEEAAFYEELTGSETEPSVFEDEDIWVLPQSDPSPSDPKELEYVLICEDKGRLYLAGETEGEGLTEQSFEDESFYTIEVTPGDKAIDFAKLQPGDRVRTTSFNGVFVKSLPKAGNAAYDAELIIAKNDIIGAYRAFELDHPEIFWLTGNVKLRVITTNGSDATSYFFLSLADSNGYSLRIPDFAASGAIRTNMQVRDAQIDNILKELPDSDVRTKVAAINRWLTLHNEYNRSQDLNNIGYLPRQSLTALAGAEGTRGPVCAGYSKAFKTLCDRLNIPCTLVTGVATRPDGHTEYHMWNQVQVDGVWYAVDCTWNDPLIAGINGPVSGKENERFLLVGGDTVVDGVPFKVSHKAEASPSGVSAMYFSGLLLEDEPEESYMPFADVCLTDWFQPYVKEAVTKKLMGGTASDVFDPQSTATRGQIAQILYNAAGQPEVSEEKVDGWYAKAASWAVETGCMAGYTDGGFHGDDPVTREQLATILWAYSGAPKQEGALDYADAEEVHSYAEDALLWARAEGILSGKPGNLVDPQGTATRAEIATVFANFMK